jgi:cytochrome c553
MKQLLSSLLLFSFTVVMSATTMADNSVQQVINSCNHCHSDGHNAMTHLSVAPVLDGMPDWYIEKQMENFRTGKRFSRGNDANEINTAHQSQALNEDTLSLVADYYDELELRFAQSTVRPSSLTGQSEQGAALFEDRCANCHTSMIGRFLTDSPKITHLEGDYLVKQLEAFKNGERQFFDENKHQRKMVERIKKLSTQDLLDIVSYIKANAQSL